ncbi:hypothetical protein [Nocardioides ochotonae]|uniref:hypothetical protein n=1 Tax=Nocardioides ochotonae TaxID=2685869 RepID=UPI00140CF70D|nr:hypothetical protein [Nocardioides ochotonae]
MRATDGTGQQGHTVPRHVWVAPDGRWEAALPGVLLDWRKVGASWEALVMWGSGGGNVASAGHTQWLSADKVRKVD